MQRQPGDRGVEDGVVGEPLEREPAQDRSRRGAWVDPGDVVTCGRQRVGELSVAAADLQDPCSARRELGPHEVDISDGRRHARESAGQLA
jgi:hypothetical protein